MSTKAGKKWLGFMLVAVIAHFAVFLGLSLMELGKMEEEVYLPAFLLGVLGPLLIVAAIIWGMVVKAREEQGSQVLRSKRVARTLLQWAVLLWLLWPFPSVDTGLVFSGGELVLASSVHDGGIAVVLLFSPFATGLVFVGLGLAATRRVLIAVFSGLSLAATPALAALFLFVAGMLLMVLGLILFGFARRGIESTFSVSARPVRSSERLDTLAETDKELASSFSVSPPLSVIAVPGLLFIVAMRVAAQYLELSVLSGAFLVLAGFALLLTAYLGWHGWRMIRVWRGVSKHRPVDITHQDTPPSSQTKPIIDTLAELSFKRLGETLTELGESSGVTWVLIDPQATVVAEVVESDPGAMLLFSTTYTDEAVVETGYPSGERINTSSFRSHTIATSVQDAYTHQMEQIAELGDQHGVPRRVGQMRAYFEVDAIHRLRHARRKLRRYLWMGILHLAALGSSLSMLLVFLLLLLREPSRELVTQRFWALNLQLVLAAVISYLMLSWAERGIGGKRGEARKK
jgi:hypothetical protein